MSTKRVARPKQPDANTWSDFEVRFLVEAILALRDSALYARFAAVMASDDGGGLSPRAPFFRGAKMNRLVNTHGPAFWALVQDYDGNRGRREQLKRLAAAVVKEAML